MGSGFKCVQPGTPGSFFLATGMESFNSISLKAKPTSKQTKNQLGDFFPPSWAFFTHSWPLCKAMLVTNIRAQDWAQGRTFAGTTFLEAPGNAVSGECSRSGGSCPELLFLVSPHRSLFGSQPPFLNSSLSVFTPSLFSSFSFLLSLTPCLYFLIPPSLS